MLKAIKDKLFYYVVQKNTNIKDEYEQYVLRNLEEHSKRRLKHWLVLCKLNVHYRILGKNTALLYRTKISTPKASSSQRRLPYTIGPESKRHQRRSECSLANALSAYDVISFDIFDTLILRPFSQPHELFMMLAYKFDTIDFLNIRRSAEREARKLRKDKFGDTEITIYDIYSLIEKRTGIPAEVGVQTEFETELEFCYANPYLLRVFKMLKAQGKKLLAVSDMYFPEKYIEQLLNKCGFVGFDRIFVSCDYTCNKREGFLYDVVKNQIGENYRYAHIGDNKISDIASAREHGFSPYYYKNVHELGNPYRCDGMSEFTGAVYRGIVNTHLYNGTKYFDIPYEFGFTYGGLYVLGYCCWIHKYAKKNGIEKVLFLSRDGEIYQKVFDYLFNDVANEYVYWSRIANLKYVSERFKTDFINRVIIHRTLNVVQMTIHSLFEAMGLSPLESKLDSYGLSGSSLVVKENSDALTQFVLDYWNDIILLLNQNLPEVKKYLSATIGSCKKIAIVDVGWQASGPLGIKYLIQEKWKIDCKIDCLVAATRIYSHNGNLHTIMDDDVVPYIFSRMLNRNLYDTHANTNCNTNNIYFELFTQATSPSFAGWDKNGKYLFEIPETEDYDTVTKIQQGIFDFCKIYNETFKKYPFMFNIAGYDAYLPYRFLIRDISYFKRFFGNFRYSRNVIGDEENQSFETLGDIMERAGL